MRKTIIYDIFFNCKTGGDKTVPLSPQESNFAIKKGTVICVPIKFAKREVQEMKQFNQPTVETLMFSVEDVLTTSAPAPTEPSKPTAPETPGDDFE